MGTRVARRIVATAGLTTVIWGVGAAGASQAVAACGIDANLKVAKQANGSRYVSGSGNAFCSAPAPAFNVINVTVSPRNLVIGLLVPGSSHTAAGSCNNGACSVTPVFFGYTVPASPFINLLNGTGPLCFNASFNANSGGSRTVTACG